MTQITKIYIMQENLIIIANKLDDNYKFNIPRFIIIPINNSFLYYIGYSCYRNFKAIQIQP